MYNGKYTATVRIDLHDMPDSASGYDDETTQNLWRNLTNSVYNILSGEFADEYIRVTVTEKKSKLTHTQELDDEDSEE